MFLGFGKRSSVSKDYLLLKQLNLPVSVFSKNSTISSVGKTIITFERSRSVQLFNDLAELHFLGLKPYLSYIENDFQWFHRAK